MRNVPLMVKAFSENCNSSYLVSLQCLTLLYDRNNKFIDSALDLQEDRIDELVSIDGQHISIESLRASSYDEFLVQLDLHNLLYGEYVDPVVNDDIESLKNEIIRLKEENAALKRKLDALKSILK